MYTSLTSYIHLSFLSSGDVRVGGQGVQPGGILFGSVRREDSFTIRAEVDDIGQEGVETFSIPLTINPSLNPPPVSVFVTGDAAITVIDTTGELDYTVIHKNLFWAVKKLHLFSRGYCCIDGSRLPAERGSTGKCYNCHSALQQGDCQSHHCYHYSCHIHSVRPGVYENPPS